jgi:photosystem II stability/assembly factor-like uncharacterized protein
MRKHLLSLLAVSGALLFMGAGCVSFGGNQQLGPVGMFRSADKGETWTAIASYPTAQGIKSIAGVNVYRTFTDPSDVNALYLASRGQGMFYTYDNGNTWQRAEALSGKFIYGIAVDPSNKCIIYVTDGTHIFKTVDCSRTWRTIYTEERPLERMIGLAIDYGDPRVVYAGEVGGDILLSVDAGASWKVVKRFNKEIQALATDPLAANRLYVASYSDGLYRSDNRGTTWLNLGEQLKTFSEATNFYRLVLHPKKKDTLYWISKYGILYSTTAGESWNEFKLITPPGSVNIYAFGVNPNNDKEMYYVGTILGEKNIPVRTTFYKTIDGGNTWITKKLPTNTVPITLDVHRDQNNVLFLGFTTL